MRVYRAVTLLRLGIALAAFAAVASLACSVPNLEKPQCTAARETVKRFYSFHFGNRLETSAEIAGERARYLTPRLIDELSHAAESKVDYFTQTENFPKAFRVGTCTADNGDAVTLEVLMLWRDDMTSRQEEIKVHTARSGGDNWLIDKVTK